MTYLTFLDVFYLEDLKYFVKQWLWLGTGLWICVALQTKAAGGEMEDAPSGSVPQESKRQSQDFNMWVNQVHDVRPHQFLHFPSFKSAHG